MKNFLISIKGKIKEYFEKRKEMQKIKEEAKKKWLEALLSAEPPEVPKGYDNVIDMFWNSEYYIYKANSKIVVIDLVEKKKIEFDSYRKLVESNELELFVAKFKYMLNNSLYVTTMSDIGKYQAFTIDTKPNLTSVVYTIDPKNFFHTFVISEHINKDTCMFKTEPIYYFTIQESENHELPYKYVCKLYSEDRTELVTLRCSDIVGILLKRFDIIDRVFTIVRDKLYNRLSDTIDEEFDNLFKLVVGRSIKSTITKIKVL